MPRVRFCSAPIRWQRHPRPEKPMSARAGGRSSSRQSPAPTPQLMQPTSHRSHNHPTHFPFRTISHLPISNWKTCRGNPLGSHTPCCSLYVRDSSTLPAPLATGTVRFLFSCPAALATGAVLFSFSCIRNEHISLGTRRTHAHTDTNLVVRWAKRIRDS